MANTIKLVFMIQNEEVNIIIIDITTVQWNNKKQTVGKNIEIVKKNAMYNSQKTIVTSLIKNLTSSEKLEFVNNPPINYQQYARIIDMLKDSLVCKGLLTNEWVSRNKSQFILKVVKPTLWNFSKEFMVKISGILRSKNDKSIKPHCFITYLDTDFRSQFMIGRSSEQYKYIVNQLPYIYCGSKHVLVSLIKCMCCLLKEELIVHGLVVPPWREVDVYCARYNIIL